MVKTKHVLRDNTNKNQGSSSLKANDTLKSKRIVLVKILIAIHITM